MKTHLLIIDPQNDFCDIPSDQLPRKANGALIGDGAPALPVAGADMDMQRLAEFIYQGTRFINRITVTLDSHASVAVERTSFWCRGDRSPTNLEAVAPFTVITAADVRGGVYMLRKEANTPKVLAMLDTLAARGQPGLMVWPVHCVTGTWGHNIHQALADNLADWERRSNETVTKVLKGEYPLAEHFGVFEAEVPVDGVPSTHFNYQLLHDICDGTDLLLVAGEASSHCVAQSVEQLLRRMDSVHQPRIVLLSDCMSPVAGFASQADAFFKRVAERGVESMSASEALRIFA